MALASDAVVKDGELIGDPTEGALVVLAEKGGLDAVDDARGVPARRRAAVRRRLQADGDVPPDAGRERPRRRPLLRQGRARPAARPRRRRGSTPEDLSIVPVDDDVQAALHGRERAARRARACACWRPARKDFDPAHVRPVRRPAAADRRADGARARRHRRPAAADGEGGDRDGARGRHPGADDHRRPRRHRRGDRAASSASRAGRSPAPSSRRCPTTSSTRRSTTSA